MFRPSDIAEKEDKPNHFFAKVEKELTSVKYKTIGKVKVQNSKGINRELEGLLK